MERVLEAKKAWRPKCLAPKALSLRKPSVSCARVKPYLASPGVSMTWKPSSLAPMEKVPPGL